METVRRGWVELLSYAVRRRPPAARPLPPCLPETDPPEDLSLALPDRRVLPLDPAAGQCFMVEYRDSRGVFSRRLITVWCVCRDAEGAAGLLARCHERGADRFFRADRIAAIHAEGGGSPADVAGFLEARLGLAPRGAAAGRWPQVLAAIHPAVQLLAGLSPVDPSAHPAAGALLAFSAGAASAAGFALDGAEEAALAAYLASTRPGRETMLRALGQVLTARAPDQWAVLDAAHRIFSAEGTCRQEELRLVEALQGELPRAG